MNLAAYGAWPLFDPWTTARLTFDALAVPRGGVQAWQQRRDARLAALLAAAAHGSRWYRERLREAGDWQRLPPMAALARLPAVQRATLMRHFADWVADPAIDLHALRAFVRDPARIGQPFGGRYLVCESSGSSGGEPGLFVQDAQALAVGDALEAARGPLALAEPRLMRPDLRLAFVGATGAHFASVASLERLRALNPWLRGALRMISFLQPIEAVVAALNEWRPALLATYPSMAWVLAEERRAGRLAIAPEALWTGGETLSPALRAALGAAFGGATLRDSYGASECLAIAGECRCGRLHLNADWVILEPVDARARVLPPGRVGASTLLTWLGNHVQPILRLDIGDRVRVARDDERCDCGSALPLLEVEGRSADLLSLRGAQGRKVTLAPLALETALERDAGVFDFRLAARDACTLGLTLYGRDAEPPQPARAAAVLRKLLDERGLGRVALRLRRARHAPACGRSGKQPRVTGSARATRSA